jgi:hypothetical protein
MFLIEDESGKVDWINVGLIVGVIAITVGMFCVALT